MSLRKAKKKKEEWPGFLLKLTDIPEEIELPVKSTRSSAYLGGIFFGVCKEHHPPLHSLNLTSQHLVQRVAASKEDFLNDIFKVQLEEEKKVYEPQPIKLVKPHCKKLWKDPYLHRCPGVRKVFKALPKLHVEDLGETTSVIRGETSREIQYCRLQLPPSSRIPWEEDREMEVVTLSDIREQNRFFMSYKERMAHAHFPKEFASVQLFGPKIPASITVTELPSKRRKLSEYRCEVISRIMKSEDKFLKCEELHKARKSENRTEGSLQPTVNLNDRRISEKYDRKASKKSEKNINEQENISKSNSFYEKGNEKEHKVEDEEKKIEKEAQKKIKEEGEEEEEEEEEEVEVEEEKEDYEGENEDEEREDEDEDKDESVASSLSFNNFD